MAVSANISHISQSTEIRLADLAAQMRTRLSRWWLYRQTLSEMARLSDRDLADLGLHRSELKRVAFSAVYNS
ncbi:MAG: DUF1127 domain-containing protein [Pseudomonadota bacterium]